MQTLPRLSQDFLAGSSGRVVILDILRTVRHVPILRDFVTIRFYEVRAMRAQWEKTWSWGGKVGRERMITKTQVDASPRVYRVCQKKYPDAGEERTPRLLAKPDAFGPRAHLRIAIVLVIHCPLMSNVSLR